MLHEQPQCVSKEVIALFHQAIDIFESILLKDRNIFNQNVTEECSAMSNSQ